MLGTIKHIIENVLMTLYQTFGFSLIMTVFLMFFFMYAKEKNWKILVKNWINEFKENKNFRMVFFFVLYTTMLIFKTLLNRTIWINPITNVFGIWGLYNEKGEFTTETIENLMLFIPFTTLMLCAFKNKILDQKVKIFNILWQCTKIVFVFSLTIEVLQLFLRLGTFQLSDLVYNTIGGIIGGFIYWCGYKVHHKKTKKKDEEKI